MKTMPTMSCALSLMMTVVSLPGLAEVPSSVVYPDEEWQTITPAEAGLDVGKWNTWLDAQKPSGHDSWGQNPQRKYGVVVTRGGYVLKTFGDPDFKINSASVGKAFTSFALQLAIDEGLIKDANDPIRNYWIGEGQLDGEHKRLDRGHHQSLTFFHLHAMKGGFPVTNGLHWQRNKAFRNGRSGPTTQPPTITPTSNRGRKRSIPAADGGDCRKR